jgi:hypothetical protein
MWAGRAQGVERTGVHMCANAWLYVRESVRRQESKDPACLATLLQAIWFFRSA